jgi:hypothetical protein
MTKENSRVKKAQEKLRQYQKNNDPKIKLGGDE